MKALQLNRLTDRRLALLRAAQAARRRLRRATGARREAGARQPVDERRSSEPNQIRVGQAFIFCSPQNRKFIRKIWSKT